MRCNVNLTLATIAVALVIGCSDDPNPTGPVLPTQYDSTGYTVATTREDVLRAAMADLVARLRATRQPGVTISQSEINALLAPLRDDIAPSFKDNLTTYAKELADASGATFDWRSKPDGTSNGGSYGGYLFNEHGLEIEQLIDKGLYGSLFFLAARRESEKEPTASTIHRLLAMFGSNPAFPNTDRARQQPDILAAAYCARRDQNDGRGLYSQIKREFIRAQWSVTANDLPQAQQAVNGVFKLWERAIMATVINYTYTVATELSKTSPTDSTRGLAMHAYAECVGFLTGWRFIDEKYRTITTQQIDEALELLRAPMSRDWTCYEIWQQPVSNLGRMIDVRELLQGIYGFTDEEMISFKTNWVSVQGRM